MPDYHGADGADTLDQSALGLPPLSNIYGEAGDDQITLTDGAAVGGLGNDRIIGQGPNASAAYWFSTSGIVADLATGRVEDGLGGVDAVSGIRVLHASAHDDKITGGAAGERFFLGGGNDVVDGGGGRDMVVYWGADYDDAIVSYDRGSDTFVVEKRFGGVSTRDVLTGVEAIQFGGGGIEQRLVTPMDFTALGAPSFRLILDGVGGLTAQQVVVGEFNGDGVADVMIPFLDWAQQGRPVVQKFFLGLADGSFRDATTELFGGAAPLAQFPARVLQGDFNGDGRTDIFALDSGMDQPPFPGGQNRLYLATDSGMVDATERLPQLNMNVHGGAVGDIDRDGRLDVVTFQLGSHIGGVYRNPALMVLKGDGTGGFARDDQALPASYEGTGFVSGSTWGGLVDVNGDAWLDLIVGRWSGKGVPSQVFLNDGQGRFGDTPISLPQTDLVEESVMQVEPLDLNGDGHMDLVLALVNGGPSGGPEFYTRTMLQFLVNDGAGRFTDETAARFPQAALRTDEIDWIKFVRAVDLNGDGHKDLMAGWEGPTNRVKLLINDGHGRFEALDDLIPGQAAPIMAPDGRGVTAFAATAWGELHLIPNRIPQVTPQNAAAETLAANILRLEAASASAVRNLAYDLNAGALSTELATTEVIKLADATTSVATLAYQFFTGKIPSAGGMDYLVSPTGPNPNNLNAPYYQDFNLENRYINFAVNLGREGEGRASFEAEYGGLSLSAATKKAYGEIFGAEPTDAKVAALLSGGRDLYFEAYGRDGLDGLGTKAAMVGWLLAEAEKADLGLYARANAAFLTDLADGAGFAVDLVGTYGKPEYVHDPG